MTPILSYLVLNEPGQPISPAAIQGALQARDPAFRILNGFALAHGETPHGLLRIDRPADAEILKLTAARALAAGEPRGHREAVARKIEKTVAIISLQVIPQADSADRLSEFCVILSEAFPGLIIAGECVYRGGFQARQRLLRFSTPG